MRSLKLSHTQTSVPCGTLKNWLNKNIQQYLYTERKKQMQKANAFKSRGQQEKEEELRRVPREYNLRLRSTLNVYFSGHWLGPAASRDEHSVPHGKLL